MTENPGPDPNPKLRINMGRTPQQPPTEHESRLIINMGRTRDETDERATDAARAMLDVVDAERKRLPTFDTMRPESNKVRIYRDEKLGFDLRQSSTKEHQDGMAFNPDTSTVVVCDGMGGIGQGGDVKNNFAFALAHATAELPDILALADPATVEQVGLRAKAILEEDMGITVEQQPSAIKSSFGAGGAVEWASTIAAVQRIPDTNRWRVATIGDSSVVVMDAEGAIQQGFGEVFQLIAAGHVDAEGRAEDPPVGSLFGLTKDGLKGFAQYQNPRAETGAVFTEVEMPPGGRIAVCSDAYLQKTPPAALQHDVAEHAEDWAVRQPIYGDDTSLAIVTAH